MMGDEVLGGVGGVMCSNDHNLDALLFCLEISQGSFHERRVSRIVVAIVPTFLMMWMVSCQGIGEMFATSRLSFQKPR